MQQTQALGCSILHSRVFHCPDAWQTASSSPVKLEGTIWPEMLSECFGEWAWIPSTAATESQINTALLELSLKMNVDILKHMWASDYSSPAINKQASINACSPLHLEGNCWLACPQSSPMQLSALHHHPSTVPVCVRSWQLENCSLHDLW